jgi:transcriptional regulator with XRE-family HTH domain
MVVRGRQLLQKKNGKSKPLRARRTKADSTDSPTAGKAGKPLATNPIRGHWGNRSIDALVFSVVFDFATQVLVDIEASGQKRKGMARKLGVSVSRVSQVLNSPGNLTLRSAVRYARALGKKVAVVLYDDGDVTNINGPVNSEIFAECWKRQGRPVDFFQLEESKAITHG